MTTRTITVQALLEILDEEEALYEGNLTPEGAVARSCVLAATNRIRAALLAEPVSAIELAGGFEYEPHLTEPAMAGRYVGGAVLHPPYYKPSAAEPAGADCGLDCPGCGEHIPAVPPHYPNFPGKAHILPRPKGPRPKPIPGPPAEPAGATGLRALSSDALVMELRRRNQPMDDVAVHTALHGLSEADIFDFVDAGAVTAEQARSYLRRLAATPVGEEEG